METLLGKKSIITSFFDQLTLLINILSFSKQKFGDSYIFNNVWYPQSNIVPNVNDDKGWLFVNAIRDSYNTNLKQFQM